MRLHPNILAVSIALAGCAAAPLRHYSGVIERKESFGMSGYVVSPRTSSGHVAPVRIYIRLDGDVRGAKPRYLWIEFPDSATRIGSVGDTIVFDAAEIVGSSDHVSADALREIVIVPKR